MQDHQKASQLGSRREHLGSETAHAAGTDALQLWGFTGQVTYHCCMNGTEDDEIRQRDAAANKVAASLQMPVHLHGAAQYAVG